MRRITDIGRRRFPRRARGWRAARCAGREPGSPLAEGGWTGAPSAIPPRAATLGLIAAHRFSVRSVTHAWRSGDGLLIVHRCAAAWPLCEQRWKQIFVLPRCRHGSVSACDYSPRITAANCRPPFS